MDRKPITVSEYASMRGVSTASIYRLAREGRIPCFKILTSIRLIPEDVDATLYQRPTASTAEA